MVGNKKTWETPVLDVLNVEKTLGADPIDCGEHGLGSQNSNPGGGQHQNPDPGSHGICS